MLSDTMSDRAKTALGKRLYDDLDDEECQEISVEEFMEGHKEKRRRLQEIGRQEAMTKVEWYPAVMREMANGATTTSQDDEDEDFEDK